MPTLKAQLERSPPNLDDYLATASTVGGRSLQEVGGHPDGTCGGDIARPAEPLKGQSFALIIIALLHNLIDIRHHA